MRNLIVLLLLSTIAVGNALGGYVYTLTDLGGGEAYGINDSGKVVGQNAVGHAFLYSHGTTTDLGTFDGPSSFGLNINANGQALKLLVTSSDEARKTQPCIAVIRAAAGAMAGSRRPLLAFPYPGIAGATPLQPSPPSSRDREGVGELGEFFHANGAPLASDPPILARNPPVARLQAFSASRRF